MQLKSQGQPAADLNVVRVPQFNMLPGKVYSAELITDNPGTWLLHCHVNKHFSAGMQVCSRCMLANFPRCRSYPGFPRG